MKKDVFLYLILLVVVFGLLPFTSLCVAQTYVCPKETSHKVERIQERIHNAFVESMQNGAIDNIDVISKELELYPQNNIIIYWRAYVKFYRAIFYMQYNNSKKMKIETDDGIEMLQELNNKDCEIYALLSRLQGISMQYSGMKAMLVFKQMNDNSKKALELCPNNLRANLVAASNDFYTPSQFGGGKKAEELLLKAISLPDQEEKNVFLPSWGKEEAYELIIRLYISREEFDKAVDFYRKAIELFPNNYMINQLKQNLKLNNKVDLNIN